MKDIKLKKGGNKDFYNFLMNHQKDATKEIDKNDVGKIILPTGTGKTYIEINTIIDDLYSNINNKEYHPSYLFTSPRLLINNQTGLILFQTLSKCIISDKCVDILFVGSDGVSKPELLKYFKDNNYKLVLRQNLYSGGATYNNIKSVEKKLEVARNQYQTTLDSEIKKAINAGITKINIDTDFYF